MKVRMAYDLGKAFIQKRKFFIYLIVVTFVLTIFFAGLKIYISIFFPAHLVLQKAQELIAQYPFAINFDDIEIQYVSGLVIRNLKISAEGDFNRGRNMFFADKVIVSPKWPNFFKGQFVPEKIYFSQAQINFYIEKNQFSEEDIQPLNKLLEKFENMMIYFSQSQLNIFFIKSPYEKDLWSFANVKGKILFDEEKKIFLEYFNPGIDQGEFFLEFNHCEKFCLALRKVMYKFEDFPLTRLNIFLNKEVHVTGKADGFFSQEFNSTEKQRQSELNLKELSVYFNDEIFLSPVDIFLRVWENKKENYRQISLDSDFGGNQFHVEIVLNNLAIPEFFLWETKKISEKFVLPKEFYIKGLQNLFIKFYRKELNYFLDLNFSLKEGGFYSKDKFFIYIPFFSFEVNEKKLNGLADFFYNKTKIQIRSQGEINPILIEYRPIAYPLMTGYEKETYKILGTKAKLQGEIIVENLNFEEIKSGIVQLREFYQKKVIEALQQSYAPSRIRDREFFRRFLENLDLYLQIYIKNLVLSTRDILNGNGLLKINPNQAELKLFFSPENFLELQYSYPSNIPYLSGRYEVFLNEGYPFISIWMDKNIMESCQWVRWQYAFSASGESFSDLYLSHNGRGSLFFNGIILGEEAKKRYLALNWDELTVLYKRTGAYTEIQRYEAKNQNFLLTGSGTIRESNLRKKYQFNIKLSQRN